MVLCWPAATPPQNIRLRIFCHQQASHAQARACMVDFVLHRFVIDAVFVVVVARRARDATIRSCSNELSLSMLPLWLLLLLDDNDNEDDDDDDDADGIYVVPGLGRSMCWTRLSRGSPSSNQVHKPSCNASDSAAELGPNL